jgi:hypothetical protein
MGSVGNANEKRRTHVEYRGIEEFLAGCQQGFLQIITLDGPEKTL